MSKRGSGGGSNVVLTYENIQITEDDLDCLKTHQFLNDKIINFFLIYLHRTLLNDEQREKVHIFDSFFSEALEHMDQQRVERWLRRVNVFEKDYLLVPALIDEHWFLIIICHPVNITKPATGRATTTNNNNSIHESPRRKRSRIVILDSMPDHARLKKPHLIEYLYNFFRIACVTQKNMSRSEIGNLSQRMQNFESEVIAQSNNYDCGICMLVNAEKFLMDAFNISGEIDEIDPEIDFRLSNARLKRQALKKLIRRLADAFEAEQTYSKNRAK